MRRKLKGAFAGKQHKVVDGETAAAERSIHKEDDGEMLGEEGGAEKDDVAEGDRVGDRVEFGGTEHFIIDIFENEILELGDSVDWNFKNFKTFDALKGDAPRDHHFYYSRYSAASNVNVEREWRGLDGHSSVDGFRFFIRAYKGRKDLMRLAVSVSYPHIPFCHEFSFRLASSRSKPFNVSDIFTHVQDTVLNPRNNTKQKFACFCLTMLDMLRRPPTGFEDLVKGHFRLNAAAILRTFLGVMDMEDDANKTIFFKMYIAFEENDAYCQHLLDDGLRQGLIRHRERESSGESSSSSRRCSKADSLWGRFFS
ncbi:PREDICTED: uncharacterized protein LOC104826347 [Tarenaya hassleriana]|uniref:uncharacterized protein LOC104826347 n=1 Tax=Tarenaya hassleriana TaxID=28532 RepID=UPI00053C4F88|nr:PREDICTED: uncharacterized protein LOC104826347 [Tarenaya hassleriana]